MKKLLIPIIAMLMLTTTVFAAETWQYEKEIDVSTEMHNWYAFGGNNAHFHANTNIGISSEDGNSRNIIFNMTDGTTIAISNCYGDGVSCPVDVDETGYILITSSGNAVTYYDNNANVICTHSTGTLYGDVYLTDSYILAWTEFNQAYVINKTNCNAVTTKTGTFSTYGSIVGDDTYIYASGIHRFLTSDLSNDLNSSSGHSEGQQESKLEEGMILYNNKFIYANNLTLSFNNPCTNTQWCTAYGAYNDKVYYQNNSNRLQLLTADKDGTGIEPATLQYTNGTTFSITGTYLIGVDFTDDKMYLMTYHSGQTLDRMYEFTFVPPPSPCTYENHTIFCDNFNRADNATVGNGWVEDEPLGDTLAYIQNEELVLYDNRVASTTAGDVEITHSLDQSPKSFEFLWEYNGWDSFFFLQNNVTGNRIINLNIDRDTSPDQLQNYNGSVYHVIANLVPNTVYHIVVEQIDNETGTFNISVNGTHYLGYLDYRYTAQDMNVVDMKSQRSTVGTQYFDDMHFYNTDYINGTNYTVPNTAPNIDSRSPISNPTISQVQTQNFSLVQSDPENDTLSNSWLLNGSDQSIDQSWFLFTPAGAGIYNIQAYVFDGQYNDTTSWNITVTAQTAPTIDDSNPASPISIHAPAAQIFSVTASDPQNDSLSYQWYKDSVDIIGETNPTYNYAVILGDAGNYNFTVVVTDGVFTVQTEWAVTVTEGYQATYESEDTDDIIVDGVGIVIASWIPFAVLIAVFLSFAYLVHVITKKN